MHTKYPAHSKATTSLPSAAWPLLALAVGTFANGTSEFMPVGLLAAVALIMLARPWVLTSPVAAALGLATWGTATFALVSSLQVRVMRAAAEAPGLASSINVGGFNLGNALGAAVGGGVIGFHLGYQAVPVAGGVLTVIGFVVAVAGRNSTRFTVRSAAQQSS